MNVKCPICGKVNTQFDSMESDGWMECEKCGSITQPFSYKKTCRIPVFSMDAVPAIMSYIAKQKKEYTSSIK